VIADEHTAVRVNDAGQVLLSIGSSRAAAALYDIASKSTTNLWTNVEGVDLNATGQALGYDNFSQLPSTVPLATSGLSLPTTMPKLNIVEHSQTQPVDLNDGGDILLDYNGWWVLGSGSSSTLLNAFLGGAPSDPTYGARINNHGAVVALSNGSLYLWDKTSQATTRIDIGANWTFDRISYFGDDGKILVHGTNTQTGSAALLLTPSA